MITWILVNTLRILKFDSHMTSLDRRKSSTNGICWLIRTVPLKLLSLTLPLIQTRDCIYLPSQMKWNKTGKNYSLNLELGESQSTMFFTMNKFSISKLQLKKNKKKYMANKVHCWLLLKNSHKYHNLICLYHKFWIN